MLGIGHCIMQWAYVEAHLGFLFHALHGGPPEIADRIWSRIRSFEAKLQVLHDVSGATQLHADIRRDWTLLRQHTLTLYRDRNRVAHSTPITLKDGTRALEPFSQIYSDPTDTIGRDDMKRMAAAFHELSVALFTLVGLVRTVGPHPRCLEPANDLVRRLRTKDDLKREEQRHRALAWRQYLQRNPNLIEE